MTGTITVPILGLIVCFFVLTVENDDQERAGKIL